VVGIAGELVRRPPQVVVAVGGGSVIDASKIAALALSSARLFEFAVDHASRSALTLLPDGPPPLDVIAVPTTLGTSSETNSAGILRSENGHRLLVGRALRPRHAVIDSRHLATLTASAVREGALEAFLRVAGAATSPHRSARARSDAVALGAALLDTAARDTASAGSRLRLARLSAATQRTAALRGQDPYSARHWYLANEVAFALGVRKIVATAAVITAVWRRICAGDARWGDRTSLERFWSQATAGLALSPDPPRGIGMLIRLWGLSLPWRPTSRELSRIAAATETSWGHRFPMLRGLVEQDFRDVLDDSWWSPQSVGRPGVTTGAKEVR